MTPKLYSISDRILRCFTAFSPHIVHITLSMSCRRPKSIIYLSQHYPETKIIALWFSSIKRLWRLETQRLSPAQFLVVLLGLVQVGSYHLNPLHDHVGSRIKGISWDALIAPQIGDSHQGCLITSQLIDSSAIFLASAMVLPQSSDGSVGKIRCSDEATTGKPNDMPNDE